MAMVEMAGVTVTAEATEVGMEEEMVVSVNLIIFVCFIYE